MLDVKFFFLLLLLSLILYAFFFLSISLFLSYITFCACGILLSSKRLLVSLTLFLSPLLNTISRIFILYFSLPYPSAVPFSWFFNHFSYLYAISLIFSFFSLSILRSLSFQLLVRSFAVLPIGSGPVFCFSSQHYSLFIALYHSFSFSRYFSFSISLWHSFIFLSFLFYSPTSCYFFGFLFFYLPSP